VIDLIVILETNYAEHLEETAQLAPVWIVNTPVNRAECERLWKSDSHFDHRERGAITSYDIADPEDRLASLLGILPTLEDHHGDVIDNHLRFPEGFALEVIGLTLTDEVIASLQEAAGLTTFVKTSTGFRAVRYV